MSHSINCNGLSWVVSFNIFYCTIYYSKGLRIDLPVIRGGGLLIIFSVIFFVFHFISYNIAILSFSSFFFVENYTFSSKMWVFFHSCRYLGYLSVYKQTKQTYTCIKLLLIFRSFSATATKTVLSEFKIYWVFPTMFPTTYNNEMNYCLPVPLFSFFYFLDV